MSIMFRCCQVLAADYSEMALRILDFTPMYNKLAILGIKTFPIYNTKAIIWPLNLHAETLIILECEVTDWPRYTTTPYIIKFVMTWGSFLITSSN